jgi:hypothetical protein
MKHFGFSHFALRPSNFLTPFEKLHFALVTFGRGESAERSEVAALAGLRIYFAGIQSELARSQFCDHKTFPVSGALDAVSSSISSE